MDTLSAPWSLESDALAAFTGKTWERCNARAVGRNLVVVGSGRSFVLENAHEQSVDSR
jgi:hypothetical protein